MGYYYKLKNKKGTLCLKKPYAGKAEVIEITKEEYDSLQPVVEPAEISKLDEIKLIQIKELKNELSKTDYLAIKHSEGWISDKDYEEIKAYRQSLRDQINELEEDNHTL